MRGFDELPKVIQDACRGQPKDLVRDTIKTFLEGDADTKADILAFFESEGPRRVHEAKLKLRDGTPTSSEIAAQFGGRS